MPGSTERWGRSQPLVPYPGWLLKTPHIFLGCFQNTHPTLHLSIILVLVQALQSLKAYSLGLQ